jgi:hypothetical protein
MRALVLLAACLAAVALLAAGCGGYGSDDKPKSGTTTSGY